MNRDENITIVMVHGTFAQEASWSNNIGSTLRNIITDHIGISVSFQAFNWSGKNSHSERIKAARKLHVHLEKIIQEPTSGNIYVIAHSHGGNVAFYALKDSVLQSKISGVICLATPYIRCHERDLDIVKRVLFAPLWLFIIVIPIVFMIVAAFNEAWILYAISLVFQYFWITKYEYSISLAKKVFTPVSRLFDWMKIVQLDSVVRISLPNIRTTPVLSINVHGDEAERHLRIIERFGNVFLRYSPYVLVGGGVLAVLGVVPWYLITYGVEGPIIGSGSVQAKILIFMTIFGWLVISGIYYLVGSIFPSIIRGHIAGFGYEGILKNALLRIFINKSPEQVISLTEITYHVEVDKGLKHSSLYENNEIIKYLCSWICKQESQLIVKT
ncbi:DUF2974 domain-containing protein [Shewanella psychropiezotolerans]|uniref:DUF2974 domain-containing protein n=1 Tax=Shewanella psychropiezotolerans TaxID=2593655 RepID=A0ABX5WYC5_9GAMM|nr:Mbeg1-like protein [Shewanella psychropiezotolerans]QDO84090.1 DUF2974 domain-containing protein [Shewanella psychropiezotolerans]